MKQKLFIILYLIHFSTIYAYSITKIFPNKHDSIRISLLTCSAGQEIYSLFGHTAIRYENYTKGIDNVFNYGMFNFNAPNFVLRFALGKTDYELGVSTYKHFATEYTYLGREVWQQTLNLRQDEKEKLITLLEENYKPENRIYRYNFFYDNCATRPRDLIEKAIDGKIQYADDMDDTNTGTSFRDILHTYSKGHPWARFGMDLCMGTKADLPISRRTMMFVPFYMQRDFNRAGITDRRGNTRPLVLEEIKIIQTSHNENNKPTKVIPPQAVAWSLFITIAIFTIYGILKKKTFWGIDLFLFPAAGVAGCILAFLAIFSQHPAVSPNYLLFIFHPLHLLCLPFILNKVRKKLISRYLLINLLILTLFVILWTVIPQRFNAAVLPLALCLLIRSISNIIICKLIR